MTQLKNYTLEIITIAAVLALVVAFFYVSSSGTHEFSGADTVGSQYVSELTGRPADSFTPLIPQYEPPSGEIESLLFALQASFGGIVLGLVFGYWLGQKKQVPAA